MKYFRLNADRNKTMHFKASEIYDAGFDEYLSDDLEVEGSIKKKLKEPLTMVLNEPNSVYNKTKELTDMLDIGFPGEFPCISKKTRSIFESLDLPLEYLEILIKGKKREILTGYYLAKYIGEHLFCVDVNKSYFTYDKGYQSMGKNVVRSINKLFFDETKIPNGTKTFVLGFGEYFAYELWVTEEVKIKIEEENLTGFEFTEVGEYKKS